MYLTWDIVIAFYIGSYIYIKEKKLSTCLCWEIHSFPIYENTQVWLDLMLFKKISWDNTLSILEWVEALIDKNKIDYVTIKYTKDSTVLTLDKDNINHITISEIKVDSIKEISLGKYDIYKLRDYKISWDSIYFWGYLPFWKDWRICLSIFNNDFYSPQKQEQIVINLIKERFLKYEKIKNNIYFDEIPWTEPNSIFYSELDLLATLSFLEVGSMLNISDFQIWDSLSTSYIEFKLEEKFMNTYIFDLTFNNSYLEFWNKKSKELTGYQLRFCEAYFNKKYEYKNQIEEYIYWKNWTYSDSAFNSLVKKINIELKNIWAWKYFSNSSWTNVSLKDL